MQNIVILTGAGISAESGLGTFRDEGGLWAQHRIEDVATPEGFARDPKLVVDFYNARRKQAAKATPNAGHIALARLEAAMPGRVLIVTQNVDDLHEKAGSKAVRHMHGALNSALCGACDARWPAPGWISCRRDPRQSRKPQLAASTHSGPCRAWPSCGRERRSIRPLGWSWATRGRVGPPCGAERSPAPL